MHRNPAPPHQPHKLITANISAISQSIELKFFLVTPDYKNLILQLGASIPSFVGQGDLDVNSQRTRRILKRTCNLFNIFQIIGFTGLQIYTQFTGVWPSFFWIYRFTGLHLKTILCSLIYLFLGLRIYWFTLECHVCGLQYMQYCWIYRFTGLHYKTKL